MKEMPKEITVKNQQVLDVFQETESMDLIGGQTIRSRGFDPDDHSAAAERACSDQYLWDKLNNADTGFRIEHSSNILIGETAGGKYFLDRMQDILHYDGFYTSGYVPHGFVGWQSDGDIGGWYVMISYSPEQKGFFKYKDESGNIVTLEDHAPWMTRAIELPSDPERVFWHCAATTGDRFTFLLLFKEHENFLSALKILEAK